MELLELVKFILLYIVCLKMFRYYLLIETFQQLSIILGMKFKLLTCKVPHHPSPPLISSLTTLPYSLQSSPTSLSVPKCCPGHFHLLSFVWSNFLLDLCLIGLSHHLKADLCASKVPLHFTPHLHSTPSHICHITCFILVTLCIIMRNFMCFLHDFLHWNVNYVRAVCLIHCSMFYISLVPNT